VFLFKILVLYPVGVEAMRRWLAGSGDKTWQAVLVVQMKPLLFCSSGTCRIFSSLVTLKSEQWTKAGKWCEL